ncbi:hypothetical protein ACNUDN_01313 [Mycobacterium sp. smrl_JER01]
MGEPFRGSEAVTCGMTWGELQRNHVRLFRDVYIAADAEYHGGDASARGVAVVRAHGDRRGTVRGGSARRRLDRRR